MDVRGRTSPCQDIQEAVFRRFHTHTHTWNAAKFRVENSCVCYAEAGTLPNSYYSLLWVELAASITAYTQ